MDWIQQILQAQQKATQATGLEQAITQRMNSMEKNMQGLQEPGATPQIPPQTMQFPPAMPQMEGASMAPMMGGGAPRSQDFNLGQGHYMPGTQWGGGAQMTGGGGTGYGGGGGAGVSAGGIQTGYPGLQKPPIQSGMGIPPGLMMGNNPLFMR